MNSPLFSIITPTFNRIHLLGETIDSVRQQTYDRWEMIIVDDGSSDPIGKLVASYNDQRISFHAFDHSGNYATARNRGLTLSQGEFIAFLDSDDTWSREKLARLAEVFLSHPTSQFVLNNVTLIGNTNVRSPEVATRHGVSLFDDLIHERDIVFYPSAFVFTRKALNASHSLNENLPTGADHDFVLRIASEFSGSFVNERLTQIRKHDANTSSQELIVIYTDSINHLKKFYDIGRVSKASHLRLTARYYYKLGLILLRNGDRKSSIYFQKSISILPMQPKAWVRYLQSIFA
ncbi:MAG TPA: glycosyltransferase family 2 protein [Cyclobacteriaceae bacterium]|nr:glycosyltransferase family 2 protein [Cyclobacteriaceae bacterium]